MPLATVSHRFHSVALRILKQRLNHAVAQPDHRVMLECYHPSEKLYTPYLYCDYLYTDSFAGVEAEAEAEAGDARQQPSSSHPTDPSPSLRGIYSHFRPVAHDDNQPRRRARHLPRQQDSGSSSVSDGAGAQAQAHVPSGSQQQREEEKGQEEERPSIDIYLDDDESFSQLCAITNLVRMGPKPGLFRSHVNVSDGVIRVWRDWLAVQARAGAQGAWGRGEDCVLWADDANRDVGLRFRVTEKDIRRQHPVLVASDEQLPVAYRLEFDELLVRSSTLLVMVEKAEVQEVTGEGRAIVLASF